MFAKSRHSSLHKMLQDLLISQYPQNVHIVVWGQVALHDLGQSPKGLLFIHTRQKSCRDKIHPLKVAYARVSQDEGS